MIVQELRELLAQAFVALALMPSNDGVLEDLLLHLLGKRGPEMSDGSAQHQGEAGLGVALVRHMKPFMCAALLVATPLRQTRMPASRFQRKPGAEPEPAVLAAIDALFTRTRRAGR